MQQTYPAVKTTYLRIEWAEKAGKDSAEAQSKGRNNTKAELAGRACAQVGQAMLAGHGIFGFGLFNEFGCYLPSSTSKAVAGHERQQLQDGEGGIETAATWVLRVTLQADEIELQMLYRQDRNVEEITAATVVVPAGPSGLTMALDQQYAGLLAGAVLDSLPAARLFTLPAASADQANAINLPLGKEVVPLAASPGGALQAPRLLLFTWNYVPATQLWLPHVVGSAQLLGRKGKKRWQLHFAGSAEGRLGQPLAAVYAQAAAGPGTTLPALLSALQQRADQLQAQADAADEALEDSLKDAANKLLQATFASSYFGLRLGREAVDPQTAVIPPGTVFGLVSEIRTGPLTGLRAYLDWVPRHGRAVNGEDLYVGWSRAVLGYSFELKLKTLLTRLELIPKFGLWTVNSRLANADGNGGVTYEGFSVNNAPSVGVEAAAARETERYTMRFWYARDFATPLGKVHGIARSVLSNRYGVDGILKGPSLHVAGRDFSLGYMLFYYHEDTEYRQAASQADNFTLDISTAYAGGGMILEW